MFLGRLQAKAAETQYQSRTMEMETIARGCDCIAQSNLSQATKHSKIYFCLRASFPDPNTIVCEKRQCCFLPAEKAFGEKVTDRMDSTDAGGGDRALLKLCGKKKKLIEYILAEWHSQLVKFYMAG